MVQVRLFSQDSRLPYRIPDNINTWLLENPGVEVIDIKIFQPLKPGDLWNAFVSYNISRELAVKEYSLDDDDDE